MNAHALKGGYTTYDRRLDRLPEWDPRNDNYPIRRLLAPQQIPRSYTWPVGPRMADQLFLDQGVEGACVGFSFAHELAAKPKMVPSSEEMARAVYKGSQFLDEWPGENYDGTSVNAGAKYLKGKGYYSSYAWTRDAYELAVTVSRKGPCVIGVDWFEDMFWPDEDGFLNIGGQVMGGHAILVKGYSVKRNRPRTKKYPAAAFTLHNSWGPGWGVKGTAYLSLEDMHTLLNRDGEACLPLRTAYADAIVR
jgi:hypothetical protein